MRGGGQGDRHGFGRTAALPVAWGIARCVRRGQSPFVRSYEPTWMNACQTQMNLW